MHDIVVKRVKDLSEFVFSFLSLDMLTHATCNAGLSIISLPPVELTDT